jgi:hypothetical protein
MGRSRAVFSGSDWPLTDIVEIWWVDTSGLAGWTDLDSPHNHIEPCRSVGFLITQTADEILLAPTITVSGAGLNPMAIPMGCVKQVRRVGTGSTK